MSPDFDAIIIGGGAAGTAAAVALMKTGLTVCLIAPAAKFPPGRTAALLTGSIDFLADIGVWNDVRSNATALKAIRLVDATGRIIRAPEVTFQASEIGLTSFGYNIANRDLVEALSSAFAGERMESPVHAIEHAFDYATVRYAGGSLTTKLVIGADGARSLSRDAAGIQMRTRTYGQSALVTTLGAQFDHDHTSTEFHTANGPFTLVPLDRRRVSLVWMGRPDDLTDAKSLSEEQFNQDVERRSFSMLGRLSVDSERIVYPLNVGIADRFAASRTALIGESAHVFPPIGAQGLNLGFRDIRALRRTCCDHLADPGAPGALEAYHRARVADVTSRTASVDLLNRSLLTGFLPVQLLRGMGLTAAAHMPPLKRFLMRQGLGGATQGASHIT